MHGPTWLTRAMPLFACGAALLVSPLRAQTTSDDLLTVQEAASLKTVCGMCHNLQVVLGAHMSYEAWHDTVQSMIDRGAQGTDEQLDDVMDYLHRNLTTINVNQADAEELGIVLEVTDSVVKTIVSRRKVKRFESLADLKSVPGINGAILDAKAKVLFFK